MRHIVLDTEGSGPTGEVDQYGKSISRVVEIAAIEFNPESGEMLDSFQTYIRPDDARISYYAFKVHGLSDEFLQDKPLFGDIYPALSQFVSGAHLYMHNAATDTHALNVETRRLNVPAIGELASKVTCTFRLARRSEALPGYGLDALCRHFDVNLDARSMHGAMIDCELLVGLYPKLMAHLKLNDLLDGKPKPSAAQSASRKQKKKAAERWSPDEVAALTNGFLSGLSLDKLAERHQRSKFALAAQLVRTEIIAWDEANKLVGREIFRPKMEPVRP